MHQQTTVYLWIFTAKGSEVVGKLAAPYVNLFNLHGVYNRIYRTSTESLFSLWRRRAPRIETGRNNRDIRATSVSVTCLIVLSASYNTTQCGSRLQCSRRRVTYSCIWWHSDGIGRPAGLLCSTAMEIKLVLASLSGVQRYTALALLINNNLPFVCCTVFWENQSMLSVATYCRHRFTNSFTVL